jgi:undecaprenyl phosphate-alpha-L-ara4N flippase subunit ArnE
MTMFALLFASVICDVAGQVCFKLGVGHHDEDSEHGFIGGAMRTLRSPWVVTGLLVYVLEFIVWFAALSLTPLSVAFPFAALSYGGVVIASRYILHERVSARRWFGTVAIAAGVALICWP